MEVKKLVQLVAEFRDKRDWKQFHNPKDLAISISIEAGELLEIFQWKNEAEAKALLSDPAKRKRVEEELADIVIFCFSMSDATGIDIEEAIKKKLEQNEKKYPVEKAKGSAKKYTEL